MYFPRAGSIPVERAVILKSPCAGRESKRNLLFSFVWAFHFRKGSTSATICSGGPHKQSLNSCRLDGQLKEDIMSRDARPFNSATCSARRKIPPKSFLSRSVVSDCHNHRGHMLSSVPLSRLSPRPQREVLLCTRLSVSSLKQQSTRCLLVWLAVHLSICFWSPVFVCVRWLMFVCLWSICLLVGTQWQTGWKVFAANISPLISCLIKSSYFIHLGNACCF